MFTLSNAATICLWVMRGFYLQNGSQVLPSVGGMWLLQGKKSGGDQEPNFAFVSLEIHKIRSVVELKPHKKHCG